PGDAAVGVVDADVADADEGRQRQLLAVGQIVKVQVGAHGVEADGKVRGLHLAGHGGLHAAAVAAGGVFGGLGGQGLEVELEGRGVAVEVGGAGDGGDAPDAQTIAGDE